MGLKLVYALFLVWLLQTAKAKLMYVNGVQQKDLTPLKPHEIDALVSGLQLFKRMVSRDANAEPQKSVKTPGQNGTESLNDNPQVPTVPKLTNDTGLAQGGPRRNLTKIEIPSQLNEIRQERGVGATIDLMDPVHNVLHALQIFNDSQHNNHKFFIMDFASRQTDETD